jgi:hypothetical protein
MRRLWKIAAAVCAIAIVSSASIALAAGGGSSEERKGSSGRTAESDRDGRGLRLHFGPGRHLSDLAAELDVSTSRLRSALRAAHRKVGPPDPPADGDRPSREDFERHCTELTDALASELGKSGDQVRAAIKSVLKKKIEAAVDAERLTRAQANRMIERIDSAACLPIGPGIKHGCGGRGGPGPGRHGGPGGPGHFFPRPRNDEEGNGQQQEQQGSAGSGAPMVVPI